MTLQKSVEQMDKLSSLINAPQVCVYVCMYVCACVYVCICMYVCMRVCVCMYVCMYCIHGIFGDGFNLAVWQIT